MNRLLILTSLFAGASLMAEPTNLLAVKDFAAGLTGWRLQPGPADFATVEPEGKEKPVCLHRLPTWGSIPRR